MSKHVDIRRLFSIIAVVCTSLIFISRLIPNAFALTQTNLYLDSFVNGETVVVHDIDPDDGVYNRVYLYVNKDTPLTLRYFYDNPKFSLTIDISDGNGYCFRSDGFYIYVREEIIDLSKQSISDISLRISEYDVAIGDGFNFDDSSSVSIMDQPIYISRSTHSDGDSASTVIVRPNYPTGFYRKLVDLVNIITDSLIDVADGVFELVSGSGMLLFILIGIPVVGLILCWIYKNVVGM